MKIGPKGFIEVDAQYRTSVPTIFAIGDVTGPPLLAHKAFKEGEIAAEVIAGMKSARDWVALPAAIFTDPEIGDGRALRGGGAQAGLRSDGRQVRLRRARPGHRDRPHRGLREGGRPTGRSKLLLGVTMCGPEASDLVAEAALALEMGAYLEDVALTIHAHPTLPEAFMEACKAALGEAIHMLEPAGAAAAAPRPAGAAPRVTPRPRAPHEPTLRTYRLGRVEYDDGLGLMRLAGSAVAARTPPDDRLPVPARAPAAAHPRTAAPIGEHRGGARLARAAGLRDPRDRPRAAT